MFLFCFYPWPYILNARAFSTILLTFLVLPSTYSVIYFEKYALYFGKFQSRVWSVPGSLFRLPLIAKRCTGDEVEVLKNFLLASSLCSNSTIKKHVKNVRFLKNINKISENPTIATCFYLLTPQLHLSNIQWLCIDQTLNAMISLQKKLILLMFKLYLNFRLYHRVFTSFLI